SPGRSAGGGVEHRQSQRAPPLFWLVMRHRSAQMAALGILGWPALSWLAGEKTEVIGWRLE
ncbi:hypothetical protein, partial [Klebsiella quasipneumoniae]|uniref:hypothetical protein n=1 Tax=Klebsiella quasipneumoniae TaxID=1463165 RepID=UPI00272F984A